MSTTKDNRFYRTKPTPKTVIIWDDGSASIRFAVLAGDYSHLDKVYVNSMDDEAKVDELSNVMSSDVELLDDFPVDAVKDGAKVIVAGFLP